MHDVPALPFPLAASHQGVWTLGEDSDAVIAQAPAHTDFYVDPAGAEGAAAPPTLNAATLLGTPPAGDYQFSARVSVDFRTQFDAGVLMLWIDERRWAKFCFEYSPAAEPMVVSVVTRGVSDDANAFVVPARSVWLRIARIGSVYAFHASVDGVAWSLVRVFSLGPEPADHQVGFEAQSPTGEGCTVLFTEIRFSRQRLADLRDGS
jgi:regulation of enolase protein 1 (concanavalin A-like superfamily)